jgi:predicted transcriptional regulator|tara:strand:+ start:1065 stop:1607 length:543 start_codon:yes stop_codon:yes gene_type:complete
MIATLQQIKKIRKQLNLTQHQFAKQVGVSQSLIAKIEAERIDPSYSKAKKILDAIEHLGKEEHGKAKDIMTKTIISITPKATIKAAFEKMKKADISQLPALENNKSIGIVSESIILEALLHQKGNTVEDIMGDAPAIISTNTSLDAVSGLLRFSPLVLVSENGNIKGIITKSDLLSKAFS